MPGFLRVSALIFPAGSAAFHGGLPVLLSGARTYVCSSMFYRNSSSGMGLVTFLVWVVSKHPADVLSKEGTRVFLDNKLSRSTLCTFLKSACALFEQSKSPGYHHSVRSNSCQNGRRIHIIPKRQTGAAGKARNAGAGK